MNYCWKEFELKFVEINNKNSMDGNFGKYTRGLLLCMISIKCRMNISKEKSKEIRFLNIFPLHSADAW